MAFVCKSCHPENVCFRAEMDLALELAQARREVLEAACSATCVHCARGEAVNHEPLAGWFHYPGQSRVPCDAFAIRALQLPETERETRIGGRTRREWESGYLYDYDIRRPYGEEYQSIGSALEELLDTAFRVRSEGGGEKPGPCYCCRPTCQPGCMCFGETDPAPSGEKGWQQGREALARIVRNLPEGVRGSLPNEHGGWKGVVNVTIDSDVWEAMRHHAASVPEPPK